MLVSPLFLRLLRSTARTGSGQIPSFNSSYSCFAAHFFQKTDLACCTSIFFTSFGQTYLMSILASPSNMNVCHCGHFIPRSRVSHHCSRRPSHLPPHLNLTNLIQPCFFLFRVPFSCPCSICQGNKLLDCSVGLSPFSPSITNDLNLSIATSLHQRLPFPGRGSPSFKSRHSLSYSNHFQDHGKYTYTCTYNNTFANTYTNTYSYTFTYLYI